MKKLLLLTLPLFMLSCNNDDEGNNVKEYNYVKENVIISNESITRLHQHDFLYNYTITNKSKYNVKYKINVTAINTLGIRTNHTLKSEWIERGQTKYYNYPLEIISGSGEKYINTIESRKITFEEYY